MKPVLRSVSTWDHPNIRTWEPDDPDKIAELVFLDIGPKSEKKADTFHIRVATPNGLLILEPKDSILAVRPLVIMQRYDFSNLWKWLEQTVGECEGETWNDCVEKLRRHFNWEYDNYKET